MKASQCKPPRWCEIHVISVDVRVITARHVEHVPRHCNDDCGTFRNGQNSETYTGLGTNLEAARESGWHPFSTSPDPRLERYRDHYGQFSPDYDCEDCGKIVSADLSTLLSTIRWDDPSFALS